MKKTNNQVLWLCGSMLLMACGEQASIGADSCPSGAQCKTEALSEPMASQQLSTAATPLAATWSKRVELGLPAPDDYSRYGRALAAGPDGAVWMFRDDDTKLTASLVDVTGQILGEQSFLPPAELVKTSEHGWFFGMSAASHPAGPVLTVQWMAVCPEDPIAACYFSEVFAFGATLNAPVSRIPVYEQTWASNSVNTAYRNARGDALFLDLLPIQVRMIDLAGNPLWTTPVPEKVFGQELAFTSSGVPEVAPAALGPDGSLTLHATAYAFDGRTSSYHLPGFLLRVTEQGVIVFERYQIEGSQLQQANNWNYPGAVAYDEAGKLLMMSSIDDGDLLVSRLGDGTFASVRLNRTDYLGVNVGAIAFDSAGTVYLSTLSGGTEASTQFTLICRVTQAGTGSCVSTQQRIQAMQSTAPGVIIALGMDGLSRYDFPPLPGT